MDRRDMKFYTADRVLADLDYILDNTFVTFGDQVYRQTLGVPMGFACSPMIAVLMLCYYELRGLRDIVTLAGTRGRRVDSTWGELSLARGGRERLLDLACRVSSWGTAGGGARRGQFADGAPPRPHKARRRRRPPEVEPRRQQLRRQLCWWRRQ